MKDFLPSPDDNEKVQPEKNSFVCQIFKTTIDSFLGKVSYAKIYSGEIKQDMEVFNLNRKTKEKLGKLIRLWIIKLDEVQKGIAGDIVIFQIQ